MEDNPFWFDGSRREQENNRLFANIPPRIGFRIIRLLHWDTFKEPAKQSDENPNQDDNQNDRILGESITLTVLSRFFHFVHWWFITVILFAQGVRVRVDVEVMYFVVILAHNFL